MKLIVGLGNPEKRYETTRHNTGFLAIDALALHWEQYATGKSSETNPSVFRNEPAHHAHIREITLHKETILLTKPQTYMNASGNTVQSLCSYYKLDPKTDLLVVYDDVDLPLGQTRTSGTSSGGHNGMKSIFSRTGTNTIHRIRIGISTPEREHYKDTASYVLTKFTEEELQALNTTFQFLPNIVENIFFPKDTEHAKENLQDRK